MNYSRLQKFKNVIWKDKEEIRANWQLQRSFMPSIGETKRKQKLKGWKKAIRCALFWANDEEE